jgi:hypothetical protein
MANPVTNVEPVRASHLLRRPYTYPDGTWCEAPGGGDVVNVDAGCRWLAIGGQFSRLFSHLRASESSTAR